MGTFKHIAFERSMHPQQKSKTLIFKDVEVTFPICYESNRTNRLAIAFKDFNALVIMREGLREGSGRVPNASPEFICMRLHLNFHTKLTNGSHFNGVEWKITELLLEVMHLRI